MRIVGVDCATQDAKIGIALGRLSGGVLELVDAGLCSRERSAATLIMNWLQGDEASVIAIDAPLGWPKPLAEALIGHLAGATIEFNSNDMFRRTTDMIIHREHKKIPLDVGADRIARTAHAALCLLGSLRQQLGQRIPLAWQPSDASVLTAIEVYPAATLTAHRIRAKGYKQPEQLSQRHEIVEALSAKMRVHEGVTDLTANADLLDAAVCVLAGADFLSGCALPPENLPLAQREGWIWTRRHEAYQPSSNDGGR